MRLFTNRAIRQHGYMDTQLPPIIIGGLLIVSVVTVASSPDSDITLPAPVVYLLVAIALACFAWGMHVNAESLRYPESPFNKHVSPWLIASIIFACLAHSAWVAFKGPIALLSYVFVVAIVVALGFTIRTVTQIREKSSESKLP